MGPSRRYSRQQTASQNLRKGKFHLKESHTLNLNCLSGCRCRYFIDAATWHLCVEDAWIGSRLHICRKNRSITEAHTYLHPTVMTHQCALLISGVYREVRTARRALTGTYEDLMKLQVGNPRLESGSGVVWCAEEYNKHFSLLLLLFS